MLGKPGIGGRPLQTLSTQILSKLYRELQGKLPLVGVGGVTDGKCLRKDQSRSHSAASLHRACLPRSWSSQSNLSRTTDTSGQRRLRSPFGHNWCGSSSLATTNSQKSDCSFDKLLYCYVLVLGATLAENRESGEIPELSRNCEGCISQPLATAKAEGIVNLP